MTNYTLIPAQPGWSALEFDGFWVPVIGWKVSPDKDGEPVAEPLTPYYGLFRAIRAPDGRVFADDRAFEDEAAYQASDSGSTSSHDCI